MNCSPQLIILNKSYIKMRYVPIITSLLNQMRYVPLITNLINETVINSYYIHYHLSFIHYKQKWIKHQTTWIPRFLRGNPVTGEKTTKASLTSKFTLPDSTLAGATTPYNLLKGENKLPLYNWLPGTNRKGLQPLQAYWVGHSTTLPPCKDKIEKERLKEKDSRLTQCKHC